MLRNVMFVCLPMHELCWHCYAYLCLIWFAAPDMNAHTAARAALGLSIPMVPWRNPSWPISFPLNTSWKCWPRPDQLSLVTNYSIDSRLWALINFQELPRVGSPTHLLANLKKSDRDMAENPRAILKSSVKSKWWRLSSKDHSLRTSSLSVYSMDLKSSNNRVKCLFLFQEHFILLVCLQCLDTVGWAAGRASGL